MAKVFLLCRLQSDLFNMDSSTAQESSADFVDRLIPVIHQWFASSSRLLDTFVQLFHDDFFFSTSFLWHFSSTQGWSVYNFHWSIFTCLSVSLQMFFQEWIKSSGFCTDALTSDRSRPKLGSSMGSSSEKINLVSRTGLQSSKFFKSRRWSLCFINDIKLGLIIHLYWIDFIFGKLLC